AKKLSELSAFNIKKDCHAVLKIRKYSPNYWLVVMQSFDQSVKSISVDIENEAFLSCTNDNSNIVAKYRDGEVETKLSHIVSPLMCEFYVKEQRGEYILRDDEISKTLKMHTNGADNPSGMDLTTETFKTTCNPDIIKEDGSPHDGDNFIVKVEAKWSNVICPDGFALEYKRSKYSQVDSIICEKDASDKTFKYTITANNRVVARKKEDINARCSAPKCAQCDYLPSVANLTISDVGTCKQLQCIAGRLMVGKKSYIPKCDYHNGKHVWMLDKKPIEKIPNVECRTTQQCDVDILTSKCEMGPEDSRCVVGTDDFPHCSNDKLHLDGQINSISCNIDDGQWKVNGSSDLSAEATFDCG
ncbi:hypothetical protein PFISCL1PPCAC_11580, partial [Pristionchus fissidentatus]